MDSAPMISYPNPQPIQQFPVAPDAQSLASYQELTAPTTRRTSARIAKGRDLRVEPSHDLPLPNAMRPQQLVSDPSSSGKATPAATPTTLHQDSQSPYQEQSHSSAQFHSPVTVQGDGLTPQIGLGINIYSNVQSRPGHLDAANLQPQSAPYLPYQSFMNDSHGGGTLSMAPSMQPNPDIQVECLACPRTLTQAAHFESIGQRYPDPRNPSRSIDLPVQSAEMTALPDSSSCVCGPGCNCVFCTVHPYNPATRARMQNLGEYIATNNIWNHTSPRQSGYAVTPTNGTNMDSVLGQGYPPLDEASFPSAASGWTNAPIQGAGLQPTFDERASVENGDHSNGNPHRLMRNSDYYTIPYPMYPNCTDATGTCLCRKNCTCRGCVCHLGHNGLPN